MQPIVLGTAAMGTRFEFVLWGDSGYTQRALVAAGEAALEQVHATEARWSLFRSSSRLAELNRSGHLRPLALDGDDLALFETITAVHAASRGAFDPDVARAMSDAGHFDADGRSAVLAPKPRASLPRADWRFDRELRSVRFTAPGPALDLGGIAKGHALDLAARELEALGVTSALLHGGTSSVLAIGTPPGQASWSVQLGGRPLALTDRALAHSNSAAQIARGTSHIRMPHSGHAPAPQHRVATVLAPTAALADAWATALCARPELTTEAAAELTAADIHVLAPGARSALELSSKLRIPTPTP